jgi:hypothetical protein
VAICNDSVFISDTWALKQRVGCLHLSTSMFDAKHRRCRLGLRLARFTRASERDGAPRPEVPLSVRTAPRLPTEE